ncbi:tetratricopeptide repeat protein [Streptomyces sp. ISL-98]|uniref:tetratricopeptide repeat protein n=1 Tax=Streptomyces sp. ISL-98 TaxID=2819192 RepID=UPI0020352384|nr:tetratricopeptide repeat protein [Streptomyces sp. ISL-98]
MPGCGKTAIAQTLFAEAVREHDIVGLWVNAATEPSFRSGMLAVAQDRGATQDEVDAARDGRRPAADLVWHRLEQSAERWLLVLDNADDPAALGDGVWLRPSRRGTVLITTRHGNAPLWRHAQPHRLDVLDLPDAVSVLLDLNVPAESQAKLEELAQALGCHPLALVLAGTYLGRRLLDPVTVDEFLERLRRDPSSTLDEGADPAERDLRRLISSTWQISLNALTDRGVPEASTLIRLLSCFASDPLPVGLLHSARLDATGLAQADPPLIGARADSALEGLRSQSMVATLDVPGDVGRPDVKCIQAHALLLDTVAACIPMDQRETIQTAAAMLLEDLLFKGAGEGTFLDAQSLRLFTPHALALLERTTRAQSTASARALAVVRYLRTQSYDRSDYTAAHTLAAAAAAAHDTLPTPDVPAALADRHELARTIAALGRYGEAAAQLREVLAAREEQLGPTHRHTLDSAQELALSLYGLGAWAEDEVHARSALEGRTHMLGSDHPDTIISAACLAEAVGEQQRWDEAEGIARPNLDRSLNALGKDHPNTLAACHTLAWVLFKKGQIEEARSLIEGTLAARIRILGAAHPRTLAARSMFANILRAQEQWQAAKHEALTVLSLRERSLGSEHPHTLGLRTVLIHIQIGAGETDAALALAETNLTACVRVHGREHPDTVSCQQALEQAHTAKDSQR